MTEFQITMIACDGCGRSLGPRDRAYVCHCSESDCVYCETCRNDKSLIRQRCKWEAEE